MGDQFLLINNNALSVLLPNNFLEILIYYKNLIFHNLFLESGIPIVFKTSLNFSDFGNITTLGNISSVLLSAVYFIIGLSIISWNFDTMCGPVINVHNF